MKIQPIRTRLLPIAALAAVATNLLAAGPAPGEEAEASRTPVPLVTAFAAEFFVAPSGDDENPGTRQKPFATLEKARDAVRALKANGPLPGPVAVRLLPGEHQAAKTFELTAADSGTAEAPVVFRADRPGTATLYGGKRLGGFAPVTDAAVLERLPEEARGKVFQCDLRKQGVEDLAPLQERGYGTPPPPATLELFCDGEAMTLARWPDRGFVNGGRIVEAGSKKDGRPSAFEYLDDRHARWTKAGDAWLFGYFAHGWADRALKIRNIDPATKRVECGPYEQGGSGMEPVKWFNQGRIKYYAFNLLEELDQPGEWYLDRGTGILYLLPPSDLAHASVEIGMLAAPMLSMANVSHVRVESLVFDLSRASGMIIRDSEHCLVAGCTLKRFAGNGVTMTGGRGNGIFGCDLHSIGRRATEVVGGDRKTLAPAKHFVENCWMRAFGRLDRTYVPAVQLEGCGNRVARNLLGDCPSSVVRYEGNDHLIEYNRVYRALLESEDQGAVETFGNPTYRGVVIRHNHFSEIGPQDRMEGPAGRAAIRLDDAISGMLVYGNLFHRAAQGFGGVQINGGRDNIIENNLFAECEKGVTGGYNPANDWRRRVNSSPAFAVTELYLQRYPELKRLGTEPGLNFARRNLFWRCGPMFTTYGKPSADKFELLDNLEYPTGDPGFVDAAKGDFRLKPGAEAVSRIGFRPIPFEEIGLYPHPLRATWPVETDLSAPLRAQPVVERGGHLLAEAEAFPDRGGWAHDSQFMDLMGSPYLLAHGLGRPVADATTELRIARAGTFRVWVRTMDWVARWKAPGAPGRFQVVLEGRALETTFGAEGALWHWQDGGRVALPEGVATLALHDLTGFEGRCDAVLLTRDLDFTPPSAGPEMAAFRRACLGLPDEPEAAGEFDFIVVGGGIAGTCAAVTAARLGLKVALVQDRPVLGGNNSSEVRVWLQGARNEPPWANVGNVVAELEQDDRAHYGPANTAELYEDDKKLAVARAERNLTLLLEHRVNAVEAADGRIGAVVAQSTVTGRRLRLSGRWFADCTGDATVGALAGADFEIEPKGRMGPCNLWNVCECKDTSALGAGTAAGDAPAPFPHCPWALDLSDKPFPGRSKVKPDPDKLGGWYWESGFDRDPIAEMESIRDWNFRAMYGAWDALKNVDKVFPNHQLNWSAHILGKRESRRLLGDVVLTLDDLRQDRQFPDGAAPTGWSNDLHLPDPKYEKGFEGDAFISAADFGRYPAHQAGRAFWIPYRCLYSRNIVNLFMAGRDISVKHEALGAVRVMRTCGTEGEIIGMAAAVCRRRDASPRTVYERHLPELQDLMRAGAGKVAGDRIPYTNQGLKRPRPTDRPPPLAEPAWLKDAGPNLARAARVAAPGVAAPGVRTELLLNDGIGLVTDNSARWIGRAALPHWIEFAWDAPVRLGAARVVSGYFTGASVVAPLGDFHFQWHDGAAWRDLPGAGAKGNEAPAWAATFDAVETRRLRLGITATEGGVSRVWEVELFGPRKPAP